MKKIQNDCFLRALRREPVDFTPIWIMRQAGRYLPEYRQLRQQAKSFMTLCKTPELACQVTLQPIARFPLDAAIIFSDILTIPDAMGLGLHFIEGEGPRFNNPIRDARDIKKLGVPDPEIELSYVLEAIRLVKHELNQKIPLIGFAGSPWTIASYMLAGGSSKQFAEIKTMLFQQPQQLQTLLQLLTQATSDYLLAQIRAGVDAVMIFDTWGGLLSTHHYQAFSLQYMQTIVQNIQQHHARKIPIILFTKHSHQWLEMLADTSCDAISLDWQTDIGKARALVGNRVALQGNLDPDVLLGDKQAIQQEVNLILRSFSYGSGHIFNLGHGITPQIDPENVAFLVKTVHEESRQWHKAAKQTAKA